MKMYKIQGYTEQGVFIIHNCRAVECAPHKLHRNTIERGIFEKTGGELYSHFLYLKGHKCNPDTQVGMVP